ncbi:putative lipoprotein, partial [Trichinella spiralis]
ISNICERYFISRMHFLLSYKLSLLTWYI